MHAYHIIATGMAFSFGVLMDGIKGASILVVVVFILAIMYYMVSYPFPKRGKK